jgi:hypothetical protein
MKPPTDPPSPPTPPDPRRSPEQDPPGPAPAKRPGGHSGYKLGGEPAIGHRWDEAPEPPPATMTLFDDGVWHRHREPGEEDLLHNVDVGHEHRDVNVRAVIGSAVVMVVVAAVCHLLVWGLFRYFEHEAAAKDPLLSPIAVPAAEMPKTTRDSPYFDRSVGGPQLMTNEPRGLEAARAEEQKRLHGYGWVNQGGGVAFIPIEEAKKRLVERGLPVREGEPVAPTVGTRAPSRGEASGGRVLAVGDQPASAPEPQPTGGHSELPQSGAPTAKPQGTGKH